MITDPLLYVILAALLGGGVGFWGCCLVAASSIRRARQSAYWEGYGACNRAHAASKGDAA